jgi:hypothetical protein
VGEDGGSVVVVLEELFEELGGERGTLAGRLLRRAVRTLQV